MSATGQTNLSSAKLPGRGSVLIRRLDSWQLFSNPRRILTASSPDEVMPVIDEAEAAASEGLWACGFVAYEAAPACDRALVCRPSAGVPLAWFGIYDTPEDAGDLSEHAAACMVSSPGFAPDRDRYTASVNRILDYIRAGGTYQVNYTIRLRAGFRGDPLALFAAMYRGQPTRYATFINTGTHAICSASPELFFERDGGVLRCKPMKGTAARGMRTVDDLAACHALGVSDKDRAENVMIVDMVRNDLGRVAEPGSVRVVSLFDVEKHPTVFQMTSTVEALSGAGLQGVFKALFPCASVTGAPKVRTMQIIDELETAPRGVYCGAIGYAHRDEVRFSVAIRTAVVDLAAGTVEYGTGGGITAGSAPASEYEECLAKARVFSSRPPQFDLLETMRWDAEGYYLLDGHIARIRDSAEFFGFRFDERAARELLGRESAGFGRAGMRVRMTLSQSGVLRVSSSPLEQDAVRFRIALAAEPVDASDRFLYHKTTFRTLYEKARNARRSADDVILYNAAGEVTESTMANVVAERSGRFVTPPVSSGLLAGVFREHLLSSGRIEEGLIRVEDLRGFDRIWLVNSVRGWIETEWADGSGGV